jgi:hypothetical protein
MALEGLFVDQQASWFADFRSELLSFPAGKHDDQVDAIGLVGQLLDKIRGGQKQKPQQRPRDGWAKFLDSDDDDNDVPDWKVA